MSTRLYSVVQCWGVCGWCYWYVITMWITMNILCYGYPLDWSNWVVILKYFADGRRWSRLTSKSNWYFLNWTNWCFFLTNLPLLCTDDGYCYLLSFTVVVSLSSLVAVITVVAFSYGFVVYFVAFLDRCFLRCGCGRGWVLCFVWLVVVLLYYFDMCLYFGLPLLVVTAPLGWFYHYHGYIYIFHN